MKTLQRLKQRPFFSQWLILGTALAIFGSAIGYNISQEHERTRNREEERLLAETRIVQENITQNLIATRDVLIDLRRRVPKGRADKDLITRLQALSDAIPGVRIIGIIDAYGTFRASNRPELIGKNFRQRDYFKLPQQHPDENMLYMTPPFRSVFGVFTLTASIIVPGTKKEFSGVITASLDPAYFAPLLESVRYAPDMRTSIIHWNGDLFIIAPERADIVGKNLAQPGSFYTLHKASGRATSVFTGNIYSTGEKRMIALRNVQPKNVKLDKPLIITASRDADAIYAGWRHDALIQSGLFCLIALASIFGLYAFQLKQRALQRQADKSSAAQRESEERYHSLFDNSIDAVLLTTPDGGILAANPEACRIFGRTEEELCRIGRASIMDPTDPRLAAALEERARTGQFRGELTYVRKDGTLFPGEISTVIFRDGNGNLKTSMIVRDITGRKQAEAEREKLITELQDALNSVKTLSGLLPICAACKKIRDDQGYWKQLESYLSEHSAAVFSHSYCPECAAKMRAEVTDFQNSNKK